MNKIRRNLTMGLLLLSAAVTATAQNVFSIKDTTVNKAGTITLELALNNADSVAALQFDLSAPQGVTLQSDAVRLDDNRVMGKHELKMAQQDSVTWRFVVIAGNNGNEPLAKNSGTLMSLPVGIGTAFRSGRMEMKNVVLTDRIGNGLSFSTEMGLVSLMEKPKQSLQIFGLEQVVNKGKAAAISWEPMGVTGVTVGYYTDAQCTKAADENVRKDVGTFYVAVNFNGNDTISAFHDTLRMVINNKRLIDLGEKGTVLPTATPLLQGQPLSASVLSGGKAVIATENDTIPLPGAFAWKNGNEPATATGQYAVTFTPEDEANYAGTDTTVRLEVIPVYDVLVNNPENGSISAKGLSSNNRYAKGQTLALKALPAANYRFVGWSNGVTTDTTTWVVDKSGTISATFAPITYTVSSATNGSGTLTIKTAEGRTIASGTQVRQGTELFITAEPDEGHILAALELNDAPFTSGKYILGQEDAAFEATFAQAENEYPIKAGETPNGVIRLFKADGTAIPSGTAMKKGEDFNIMALPNAGYELQAVSFNGETLTPDKGKTNIFTATVAESNSVSATFQAKRYTLTIKADNGTVAVKDGSGTALASGSEISYNSSIVIERPQAAEAGAYKFSSLVINGRKIESFPCTWTVGSDVNIAATFEELTTIKDAYIINAVQSYKFNNQDKQFLIYTTQTYAGDFNIAYSKKTEAKEPVDGIPVKAGTYSMTITRPADEIYKAYVSGESYFDDKLEIKKAKIAVKQAPTGTGKGERGAASVDTARVEIEVLTNQTTRLTYIPKDADNYEAVSYYLSTKNSVSVTPANTIWYDNSTNENAGTTKARSARMTKAGTEATAVNGYVKVSNGGLPYEPEGSGSLSIPAGTTITLEAIPAEGYKFKKWNDNDNTAPTREFVVEDNTTSLPTAAFEKKTSLQASLASATSPYDGTLQEVKVSNIPNAQINAYKDRACTQIAELKNAGEYWISVYRPATDEENEVRDTLSYTVTPARPTVDAPTTMETAAGETLAQVQLLGGHAGNVPGTFSWKDSTAAVAAGEKPYTALFTSADPNYESVEVQVPVTGLSVKSTGSDPDPDPVPTPDPNPDPDPDPDTPDIPTSIEEIASETLLVVREGLLEIHPANQVEVAVVSINGKYLYNGEIGTVTTVRVPQSGIYIVSFRKEGKAVTRKVRIL